MHPSIGLLWALDVHGDYKIVLRPQKNTNQMYANLIQELSKIDSVKALTTILI
jgi:hypothetical protein